jgi:hypothetical protein
VRRCGSSSWLLQLGRSGAIRASDQPRFCRRLSADKGDTCGRRRDGALAERDDMRAWRAAGGGNPLS